MTTIRVDATGPFDHGAALAVLHTHRTDGLERVDDRGITRLMTVGGVDYPMTARPDDGGVTLDVDTADAAVHAVVVARTRHWFDLDADVAAIDAHLAADPVFADQVARRPGVRITRTADAFESVVETVLGQQVTIAAARLFAARLVSAYGVQGSAGLRRFPRPGQLLAVPIDELRETLRVPRSRARTVHAVAACFVDREPGDRLPAREDLAAVYGIGPWTLDYLAIRAEGDRDAFPATDAVLRRVMRDNGIGDDAVARWRPFRSYAAVRLWAMSGVS